MASGHVSRIKRPNTWLHRPMLQNVKKLLPTRSRPHMARNGPDRLVRRCPLIGVDRKWLVDGQNDAIDPKRHFSHCGNRVYAGLKYLFEPLGWLV
ncbi:hypothetical protein SAMN05443248_7749 [Bradyrhizobium erythrophlei]|uniref:Uncharacterized protein n=1 Tax=Bradyrhizobium erythrophlei TaxID=1437360 RepID=A0A1M5Y0F8_9BRAD|nr:hypothetical protein SAMN05443248_7749 [Bradyrhizobium erythrophlei]